jgi:eukaryotic-like serine/threonine-protein kinase
MPLSAGEKLGPYEILALIGKGGMGEVYRARDTRIGRDVAVKVSSETFTERFEREARAIAALNHPNTCTLYDVGPNYLVMEFVEGEAPHGPMPLATALDYARQIAAALEDAHDKGIVHRDLKPANIKITPDGRVKVLDFGLAKVMGPVAASGPPSENSPTLSMAATQAGVILGTAAYMAPEQARGLPTDRRADIWAFGVVLYEMIAGKRPFQGEDLTETLASVVRDKPDLSTVPSEVRRLLERCLEKDPKKRLRDISGVALLLELQTAHRESKPAKWPWAVAAVAVLGLAALGAIHFREAPPPAQAVQFSLEAPGDAQFANRYGGYAPSPDGRYVIVTARPMQGSTNMLWLRPLDSLTARALPGTEGGNMPTWSPDSKSIAFEANGELKRIEITGGAALTLCDATASPVTQTGTWNREGVILFGGNDGLHRVSASGGGAALLTKVDPAKKETGHGYPQFLPDGDRFLYYVESADLNVRGVYASSLKNPSQRQLIVRTSAKGVYVPPRGAFPGYLLWLQDQTLVAQHFDASSLKVEGDPVSVAEEIGLNPGNPMRGAFWASDAGLLIFFSSPQTARRPTVWVSRDGKQAEAAPDDTVFAVSIAPGAERIAFERVETTAAGGRANRDIWIRELTRGIMTRLTFDPARDVKPRWSPDGKQVAFSSDREGGVYQLYVKDASGSGQEQRMTEGPNSKILIDWTKDGKYLLFREQNPVTDRDLMAVPLDGDRKAFPGVVTPFLESTGAISPDGRWVAYASNDSGRNEIYIQAFPAPGVNGPKGRWQVSSGGGYDVKWKGDGKELYFESLDGKMMAAGIQAGPQGIHADTPRALFSADFTTGSLHEFDVTPDGQRFLLMLQPKTQGSGEKLTVVSNWQAALRK